MKLFIRSTYDELTKRKPRISPPNRDLIPESGLIISSVSPYPNYRFSIYELPGGDIDLNLDEEQVPLLIDLLRTAMKPKRYTVLEDDNLEIVDLVQWMDVMDIDLQKQYHLFIARLNDKVIISSQPGFFNLYAGISICISFKDVEEIIDALENSLK